MPKTELNPKELVELIVRLLRNVPFWLVLSLFAGLMVVLPDQAVKRLGVESLRTNSLSYFGLALLVSSAVLLVLVATEIHGRMQLHAATQGYLRRLPSTLASLSEDEWAVLLRALATNEQTVYLPITHPGAQALHNKGLIDPAFGTGSGFDWPFTIPSWAWDHLRSHPELWVAKLEEMGPNLRTVLNRRFP